MAIPAGYGQIRYAARPMFEFLVRYAGPYTLILPAAIIFVATVATVRRLQRLNFSGSPPLLLRIGMPMAAFMGCLGLFLSAAVPTGLVPINGFDGSWSQAIQVALVVVIMLISGSAAVGYFARLAWSRLVAISVWPMFGLLGVVQYLGQPELGVRYLGFYLAELALFSAVAVWYFYRRKNVVEYYDQLRRAA